MERLVNSLVVAPAAGVNENICIFAIIDRVICKGRQLVDKISEIGEAKHNGWRLSIQVVQTYTHARD